MGTQEYKITNKETGESHFAVPHEFCQEYVNFQDQNTDEIITFTNIGSVGNLENEHWTATPTTESLEEVEAIEAGTVEEEVTPEAEEATEE